MKTETKIFLRKRFQRYYWENKVPVPREIKSREFGEGTLEQKITVRHKSFSSEKDLQNHLKREAPFFISYSSAYYEFPEEQPMSEKNWLGADLTFDLDVEMKLFEHEKLERVKKETVNLLDFLLNDFGFSRQEVEVNFSGNHGYHLHVFSEKIKQLGRDERREIVDYVVGEINFGDFLKIGEAGNVIKGPKRGDTGWSGIIWQGLYNFIKDSDIKQMESISGIGRKKAELIYKNRDKISKNLEKGEYRYLPEIITIKGSKVQSKFDPNRSYYLIKEVKSPIIQKIIDETAIKTLASRDTDKMVTIDTSRLIRLPNSLHGGSGLIAKVVKNLDDFNPLEEAIAFRGEEMEIELKEKVPKFDLSGEKVGPFQGKVKVPESVGIYLLLQGMGDLSA